MPRRTRVKKPRSHTPGNIGKVSDVYACPTPKQHCTGSHSAQLSAGLRGGETTVHGTRRDVMKCYTHYLTSVLKYEKRGNTFHKKGKYAIMIPRLSQIGTRLRPGKANRHMPRNRGARGIIC